MSLNVLFRRTAPTKIRNFEEYSSEGLPNYDKMHWVGVMNSFVEWAEKLQKK